VIHLTYRIQFFLLCVFHQQSTKVNENKRHCILTNSFRTVGDVCYVVFIVVRQMPQSYFLLHKYIYYDKYKYDKNKTNKAKKTDTK